MTTPVGNPTKTFELYNVAETWIGTDDPILGLYFVVTFTYQDETRVQSRYILTQNRLLRLNTGHLNVRFNVSGLLKAQNIDAFATGELDTLFETVQEFWQSLSAEEQLEHAGTPFAIFQAPSLRKATDVAEDVFVEWHYWPQKTYTAKTWLMPYLKPAKLYRRHPIVDKHGIQFQDGEQHRQWSLYEPSEDQPYELKLSRIFNLLNNQDVLRHFQPPVEENED